VAFDELPKHAMGKVVFADLEEEMVKRIAG
jgi:hypothetical protein